VTAWLPRLVDVRRGEWRAIVMAFATLLLLITGHTALDDGAGRARADAAAGS